MQRFHAIVILLAGLILNSFQQTEAIVLVQEASLTKDQISSLLMSLERKSGFTLKEVNGFLKTDEVDREAWSWWNPMGRFFRALLFLNFRSGSPTARLLLSDSIASPYVYRIISSHETSLGRVFRGKAIDLNLSDLNRITYRNIPHDTFDAGMIFLHELVHLRERLTDPTQEEKKLNPNAKGDTVDYVNRIHRELKLPERLHYFPKKIPGRKGSWSIYFGDQNGRVEIDEGLFS